MDQLLAWIFWFASGKVLDPKAFPEDAIWQVQVWANISLSSADFHYLPAAWSHKSLLAKEGKNAFHLAVKSARAKYIFDWHLKTCYQKGVSGLVKYVKNQKQCSGKEGKILCLDCQCVDYITDVTVPPGKFIIFLKYSKSWRVFRNGLLHW